MSSNPTLAVRTLSLDATRTLMDAGIAEAIRLQITICICVLDHAGRSMGFLRMPGALPIAIDMAQQKARCAAVLGLPMSVVDDVFDVEHPRVRRGLEAHPDFTPIHGGLPVLYGGEIVGAVGVSGGSEAQDVQCAEAALAALLASAPAALSKRHSEA